MFGAALLTGVGGCAGMSPADNSRFQKVVAKNVSVGMPFVTAIEHLVKAGFSCDDRVRAPAVSCSRFRYSILPFSCIQRIAISTDPDRRTVASVTAEPIMCAGL